jgi:hypothetical protein
VRSRFECPNAFVCTHIHGDVRAVLLVSRCEAGTGAFFAELYIARIRHSIIPLALAIFLNVTQVSEGFRTCRRTGRQNVKMSDPVGFGQDACQNS